MRDHAHGRAATGGDARTLYDGLAFAATPTRGPVTETQALTAAATGSPFLTRSKATYDSWGRPITSTDAMNHTTETTYTRLAVTGRTYTGGVVKVSSKDPKGYVSTTDVVPAWGAPSDGTDANGKVTSHAYDGLGRITSLWVPSLPKATNPTLPIAKFAYSMATNAPAVVTSQELLAKNPVTYVTRYQFFDGLLRPKQTQAPEAGPDGGPWYATGALNGPGPRGRAERATINVTGRGSSGGRVPGPSPCPCIAVMGLVPTARNRAS